jgi:poly-gamma-glutamate capsule biosynthesis protein CapA/YwtB (metallophosphatase superfamily)
VTSPGTMPFSVALAGDVMIGRGIDQIMRHPGDPTLHERWARSALRYVELAEEKSGPMPRGVDAAYIWGDSPARLSGAGVDVRIVNLETALTARGRPWPGKGIHYRGHPDNADCLVAGGIDIAVVANNHILDWSEPGLVDTLDTLDRLGVTATGAGRDEGAAWQPASFITERSRRVHVLGLGSPSSGVDPEWGAGADRPGVALLGSFSDSWIERVDRALDVGRRPGDIIVVSIHWGPNWGYGIPSAHRRFAQALIDRVGVDVVHGHSSHHPMGFEIYQGRLIVYGCGDLLTDYEGIHGHEEFRPELSGWYIARFDSDSGELEGLQILPTKVHRFQLVAPTKEEMVWLGHLFQDQSLNEDIRIERRDGLLTVDW